MMVSQSSKASWQAPILSLQVAIMALQLWQVALSGFSVVAGMVELSPLSWIRLPTIGCVKLPSACWVSLNLIMRVWKWFQMCKNLPIAIE